jgi:hypothetical protein
VTKTRLFDLLRRACGLSDGQRLILAGSQALYASTSSAPALVERSEEADLLLVKVDISLFLKIEENLGMESAYIRETGVFAHPVGLGTISLPADWEDRLVPFGPEDGLNNVWALDIHDLTASKLMAGREKDFEFIFELVQRELIQLDTLLKRFASFRKTAFVNAVDDRLRKLAASLEHKGLRAHAAQVRASA